MPGGGACAGEGQQRLGAEGHPQPVATIFENLEAGASIDDVFPWYEGLDRKQVQAVIEFTARGLDLGSNHDSSIDRAGLAHCVL